MSERPAWDDQFAETEDEIGANIRTRETTEEARMATNLTEIGKGVSINFQINVGATLPHDVWIWFRGEDGKSAGLSIAALAEKMGSITGAGLRSWAADRIDEYMAGVFAKEDAERDRQDNSQFGVGA